MPDNTLEWLGELAFTHYYKTLSQFIGLDFGITWKSLNYCEQQAWVEAGKTIFEVGLQLFKADKELSMLPRDGIESGAVSRPS